MGYAVVNPSAVDRAVVEGATPFFVRFGDRVLTNASGRVNVATGALRGSLYTELINGGLGVRVGATAPYALFVHQGTRPHVIRPRPPRRVLRSTGSGGVVFVREVHHPGTRANPFLRDAFFEEAAPAAGLAISRALV